MKPLSDSPLKPVQQQLQQRLGYQFTQPQWLQLALTHRSAAREHNERLEFLGDAALGFLIAARLFREYPAYSEGELSRMRAALVSRDTLAAIGRELRLGELLQLGSGERKSGGRERSSILCDAVEAIIGAVYMDGGVSACEQCVERLFQDRLHAVQAKDAKTRLQEWMQARGAALPRYDIERIEGKEHDQLFVVRCHVPVLDESFTGSGKSRRQAEQQAAAATLEVLTRETSP